MTNKLLRVQICGCEHNNHCTDDGPLPGYHDYGKALAGRHGALWVGPVCDPCAADCMAEYLHTETHSCIECWESFASNEHLTRHTRESHPQLARC